MHDKRLGPQQQDASQLVIRQAAAEPGLCKEYGVQRICGGHDREHAHSCAPSHAHDCIAAVLECGGHAARRIAVAPLSQHHFSICLAIVSFRGCLGLVLCLLTQPPVPKVMLSSMICIAWRTIWVCAQPGTASLSAGTVAGLEIRIATLARQAICMAGSL